MSCANWNPTNLWTYKQSHILSKWNKEIEYNWKIEGENALFQKFWYENPFEELSFFNLHGLKYLGTN